jgi:chaperone required for assembly of F1-ATPase
MCADAHGLAHRHPRAYVKEAMRDFFTRNVQDPPIDPLEAARRATRPQRARRFYASAGVGEDDKGFAVLLDGRPAKTPAQQQLVAPTRALAEAIAAEWANQHDVVDPAHMPLTRLSNSIIDGVAKAPAPVAAQVAAYLDSDMLCYRAHAPEGLVARQAAHWDPIITWARDVLGAEFIVSRGVMFVAQPDEALRHARAAIPVDAWRLGAVYTITTLTGSALLALAILRRRLDVDQAWRAAHVDEDWNMELWGHDQIALERRAFRFAEMQAAAMLLERMDQAQPG